MLFSNKNETVSWLSLYLMENNLPCIGLSAILRPAERKGRIDKYKNGESQILVCTDLASRGIDTPNVGSFGIFVFNYINRILLMGFNGLDMVFSFLDATCSEL